MAVLDNKLQEKIDDLINIGNEFWDQDKSQYYKNLFEAWELYPEPKKNWNEAYSLAKEIYQAYLLDEKYDEVAVIGDAVAPRKILTAIHEGYHAIRVME